MAKISELTSGGAIVSTDELIAVRTGANVRVSLTGLMSTQSASAVAITGGTISVTTLTASGEIAANGGIALGDQDKATFGASDDLQIYHDGSNSFIQDAGTGNLSIKGTNLVLGDSGGNDFIVCTDNGTGGEVALFHNAVTKLATTATGIDVTGTVTSTGTSVFASLDISGDIDVDGVTNLDVVDIDGAVNMASTALVTGVLTTTAATVFNGGFASNAASTITTADNGAQLTLISTDTDALVGPQLNLWRNSASAANGDLIGQITFTGEDSVGSTNIYASIHSKADQVDNGSEDGSLRFSTLINGTLAERLVINSAGSIEVSDGIYLGGTVAANKLDDYEEGTWDPTIVTTTGSGTILYAEAATEGFYTKVGRLVTLTFRVTTTSLASRTGNVNIGGLPFAASAATGYGSAHISYGSGLQVTSTSMVSGTISESATQIELWVWDGATGPTAMIYTEYSDNGDLIGTATYHTDE